MKRFGKAKETILFSTQLLRSDSKEVFILQAKGKGMLPAIKPGDQLICKLTDKFQNKDIVILWDGNKFECKYFRKDRDYVFFENGKMEMFSKLGFEPVAIVESIFSHIS